jgi:hypothetical protein
MGELLLLATTLTTAVLLVWALWTRSRRLVSITIAIIGTYAIALLTVSFSSREHLVDSTYAKKFCAADCDLSLSVAKAEHRGDTWTVQVKVQSSAARVTMTPSSPQAILIDEYGREYAGSNELDSAPFARPVAPGESYIKTLVFHVPDTVKTPRLLLREGGWPEHFVVGDENSFFHKKTLILLRDPVVGQFAKPPTPRGAACPSCAPIANRRCTGSHANLNLWSRLRRRVGQVTNCYQPAGRFPSGPLEFLHFPHRLNSGEPCRQGHALSLEPLHSTFWKLWASKTWRGHSCLQRRD